MFSVGVYYAYSYINLAVFCDNPFIEKPNILFK